MNQTHPSYAQSSECQLQSTVTDGLFFVPQLAVQHKTIELDLMALSSLRKGEGMGIIVGQSGQRFPCPDVL